MTCPDCKRNEKDAMDRDKLAEELAWYKAAFRANRTEYQRYVDSLGPVLLGLPGLDYPDTDHTGSDDRSHKSPCPKHVGCLPESCGDCPRDEDDARSAAP